MANLAAGISEHVRRAARGPDARVQMILRTRYRASAVTTHAHAPTHGEYPLRPIKLPPAIGTALRSLPCAPAHGADELDEEAMFTDGVE
jgi:hypothetical protein